MKSNAQLPALLTVPELAARLRIGLRTAYNLCHEPDFPAMRVGGQIRVSEIALARWLDEQAAGERPTTRMEMDELSRAGHPTDSEASEDDAAR